MNSIKQFFDKAADDESLRHKLSNVAEGDWNAVVKIAEETGNTFSVDELIKKLPIGFFKDHGTNPELGWPQDTIPKHLL